MSRELAWSKFLLCFSLLMTKPALATKEVGNGGDEVGIQFSKAVESGLEDLQDHFRQFPELTKVDLKALLQDISIITVDSPLYSLQNGVEQECVAINLTMPNTIKVNRRRWLGIASNKVQEAIALHEVLSIAGLEGTGKYTYSQLVLTTPRSPSSEFDPTGMLKQKRLTLRTKTPIHFEDRYFSIFMNLDGDKGTVVRKSDDESPNHCQFYIEDYPDYDNGGDAISDLPAGSEFKLTYLEGRDHDQPSWQLLLGSGWSLAGGLKSLYVRVDCQDPSFFPKRFTVERLNKVFSEWFELKWSEVFVDISDDLHSWLDFEFDCSIMSALEYREPLAICPKIARHQFATRLTQDNLKTALEIYSADKLTQITEKQARELFLAKFKATGADLKYQETYLQHFDDVTHSAPDSIFWVSTIKLGDGKWNTDLWVVSMRNRRAERYLFWY